MAARGKRRGHRAKKTLSLAMIAGLAPLGLHMYEGYKQQGAQGAIHNLVLDTTGWYGAESRFDFAWPIGKFYGPLAMGFVAHTLASRLGINRALGRAGIPFVRI